MCDDNYLNSATAAVTIAVVKVGAIPNEHFAVLTFLDICRDTNTVDVVSIPVRIVQVYMIQGRSSTIQNNEAATYDPRRGRLRLTTQAFVESTIMSAPNHGLIETKDPWMSPGVIAAIA
jgi:hypothetical protein